MNPQVTLQSSNEFSLKNASGWSLALIFLALGLAGSILVFKTAKAAYLVVCGQPAQAICYRIETNSSSHRGHQRKSRQYFVEYQTANGAIARGRIVPGFGILSTFPQSGGGPQSCVAGDLSVSHPGRHRISVFVSQIRV